MRKLRDLLTMLMLCSLVGLSAAATVQAIRTGLPAPVEDRHEELRRSLAAGRVNELPIEYQRVLLRQMENELREGVDWQRELAATPRRQRNLVADNLADLGSLWLNEKMEEYFSLPNEYEQEKYLDQEIERVLRWQTTQSLRQSAAPGADPRQRELGMRIVQRMFTGRFQRPGGPALGMRQLNLSNFTREAQFFSAVQERWKELGVRSAFPTGPAPGE